ncbi:hypothetical protein ACJ41O_013753 [Fusarium nematophilum]
MRVLGEPKQLTWTLSYLASCKRDVTGFVVDEQSLGSPDGVSVFMYPMTGTIEGSVTSGTFHPKASWEVIEHGKSMNLMESIAKQDGLRLLYEEMRTLGDADYGNAVADLFHATQQYELALRVARLVFDPTVDGSVSETEPMDATACWKFPPFRDMVKDKTNIGDKFTGWPNDSTLDIAVMERRTNPSTALSTARGRPQACMKWIMMKYIEILIASRDEQFRQGSLETLPLAIQRYIEAAHVLGPEPPKMPKLGKVVVRSYRTLRGAKTVDLGLAFPFMCNIKKPGAPKPSAEADESASLLCFLRTSYFCLPPNTKYQDLRTLVNKAIELCAELLGMSDQFLQAKEKQGSEALSLLKPRQDMTRQKMLLDVKHLQRDETQKSHESFLQNRDTAIIQVEYYLGLIGEPLERIPGEDGEWQDIVQQIDEPTSDDLHMSRYEMKEMLTADIAHGLTTSSVALEPIVSALRALPRVKTNVQPMGCGPTVKADATFPGHYMRRITSVAISIPLHPRPLHKLGRYSVAHSAQTPRDLFRTDAVPISSVGISSGVQDSGTFELTFKDERFQPFEGAGAVSSWKLELPPLVARQFDYNTISSNEALTSEGQRMKDLGDHEGLWGFIDLKNDLANEWYSFHTVLGQTGIDRKATIDLSSLATRLPFWATGKEVKIERLTILVTGKVEEENLVSDVSIEALALTGKDRARNTLGDPPSNKTLLAKQGVDVSIESSGWKSVVSKKKGEKSGIEDMSIIFRCFIGGGK